MPEPTQVRSMFSRIAGIYDLLNRVLSLGIDQRWRRLTVRRAGDLSGALVVDACCGTGAAPESRGLAAGSRRARCRASNREGEHALSTE